MNRPLLPLRHTPPLRPILAAVWLVLGSFFASLDLRAEEVAIELAGLDITANLELAPGRSLKKHGVLLLVHDTQSHNRNAFMSALQQMLRQRGINTLAINLSYGLNRRMGPYDCRLEQDHRHADALAEIEAWFGWLKAQGVRKIILGGRGRGANQAALFLAKRTETSRKAREIKGLVLISPMIWAPQRVAEDFQRLAGKPLSVALARAQKMINDGENGVIMPPTAFLTCPQAQVTADAFAAYYTPNPRHNTLNLLPSILVPTMAIAGALDPGSTELAALMTMTPPSRMLSISIIEGVGTDFQGPARETLADSIKTFISSLPRKRR